MTPLNNKSTAGRAKAGDKRTIKKGITARGNT
jgi:hypothetical protein